MVSYSDVKILDKDGNLIKIITAESISKKLWKDVDLNNRISKDKTTAKATIRTKSNKTYPMIICGYKPCSKSIQQIHALHRFCIHPLGYNESKCATENKKLMSRNETKVKNLARTKSAILSKCGKCKKDFLATMRKQKFCRNPCISMRLFKPIIDIECKLCKKITKGRESRLTIFCQNPCNIELWRVHQVNIRVDRICGLCKKVFAARVHVKSIYCQNPCNASLAIKTERAIRRSNKITKELSK